MKRLIQRIRKAFAIHIVRVRYKYLRWLVKNFGVCAFRHKDWGVYDAGYNNCVYKCDRCGETWFAK